MRFRILGFLDFQCRISINLHFLVLPGTGITLIDDADFNLILSDLDLTHPTVDRKNPAPVEVGSLSHYLRREFYIPSGWPWDF